MVKHSRYVGRTVIRLERRHVIWTTLQAAFEAFLVVLCAGLLGITIAAFLVLVLV
jgi:hypothetical protein